VQKGVKRTFNNIIQGRQGVDCKNQDLSVKILKGGRTGLLKFENSGALKKKGRGRTVDPAVGAVHKPTVDQPLNAKGYAILAIRARSNGPGRVQAMGGGDVAGERRHAAGARWR
jgi:hypothetical protein